MTPREFKAWFEGFTEALSGTPTKAQWARIKERVAEIDGQPLTERYFIDRYWPHWTTYTAPMFVPSHWPTVTCGMATGVATGDTVTIGSFDGCSAMNAFGQSEARALS